MEAEDRDMANAAMLLDEKINERIAESFKLAPVTVEIANMLRWSPQVSAVLQELIQAEVAQALAQLHERLKPTYTYGSATGRRYW